MKTLWLLRHAKSSWADATLTDHDRPLKPRGIRAAAKMGALLAEQSPFPELICCSTAVRAVQTWHVAAEAITARRSLPEAVYRDDLYHASVSQLRSIVSGLPNERSTVLLIGHNPGFEDFVAAITGGAIEIPTAALLKLQLAGAEWHLFATTQTVGLIDLWRPRERD
ncbi:MAG TPA: histidine phosphatase family protein [Planctomycetaceae bacterium]|nr:histidine phosphatase family protein [Planctomycetaceae bacterium]